MGRDLMGRDEDEQDGTGATPPRRRGRHHRVVRAGTEQSTVDGVSSDELPVGWSDPDADPDAQDGSHDAELRRNVPPHWS